MLDPLNRWKEPPGYWDWVEQMIVKLWPLVITGPWGPTTNHPSGSILGCCKFTKNQEEYIYMVADTQTLNSNSLKKKTSRTASYQDQNLIHSHVVHTYCICICTVYHVFYIGRSQGQKCAALIVFISFLQLLLYYNPRGQTLKIYVTLVLFSLQVIYQETFHRVIVSCPRYLYNPQ